MSRRPPLLLLKAVVPGYARRGPGGRGVVVVKPYTTRVVARPDQGDLFAARPAPAPATPSHSQAASLVADDPAESGQTCPFCGGAERVGVLEAWGHDFMLDTCCEARRDQAVDDMQADPEYGRLLLAAGGIGGLRRVAFTDDGFGRVLLDFEPQVGPIGRKEAMAFIARWHRHNPPLPGDVFRAGIWNGSTLLGVVVAGAPAARAYMPAFQRKELLEVRRLCIRDDLPRELTWRAASALYRHAADEAARRGYQRIITYTLQEETGMSLRYARWKPEATTTGGSWDRPSRPRQDKAPTGPKVRWSRSLRQAA